MVKFGPMRYIIRRSLDVGRSKCMTYGLVNGIMAMYWDYELSMLELGDVFFEEIKHVTYTTYICNLLIILVILSSIRTSRGECRICFGWVRGHYCTRRTN